MPTPSDARRNTPVPPAVAAAAAAAWVAHDSRTSMAADAAATMARYITQLPTTDRIGLARRRVGNATLKFRYGSMAGPAPKPDTDYDEVEWLNRLAMWLEDFARCLSDGCDAANNRIREGDKVVADVAAMRRVLGL